MKLILLVTTITVLIKCNEVYPCTKKKSLFHNRDGLKIESVKDIFAISRGYHQNLGKSVVKINAGRGIGRMLFQNDIALTKRKTEQAFNDIENNAREKRLVLKDFAKLNSTWNSGVFYTFNTSDEIVQKAFKMGVKVWSDATCVDFTEDENAQDKVVVVKLPGCFSNVGRIGGDQLLSIGEGYITEGEAAHEIGHALGLLHTMARYDRDSYIRIIMGNVDPLHTRMFAKVNENYTLVYGLAYDYGSIMHYGELSGSINQQPTIIALDPHYQETMGSGIISFSDIFMINQHYGCNAICNKSTSAKCENEGYPHPRNCSVCICPSGYGGTLCDRRPPGCGEELVATSEEETIIQRLGFGYDLRDQFDFCHYMIMAPEGKKIEVNVKSISEGYGNAGCTEGGVEIKAQEDQKLTGYRFCSTNGSGNPIVSSSNPLPVILFNRFGSMEATFTYRSID